MSSAVNTAVRAYIASNWSHTPIAEPMGTADQPADAAPWLTIDFLARSEEMLSTGIAGDNAYWERGGIHVALSLPYGTPVNDAAAPWETRLDTLRGLLRGKTIEAGTNDVVTYGVSGIVEDEGEPGGSHYRLTFAVEYSYEIHG